MCTAMISVFFVWLYVAMVLSGSLVIWRVYGGFSKGRLELRRTIKVRCNTATCHQLPHLWLSGLLERLTYQLEDPIE